MPKDKDSDKKTLKRPKDKLLASWRARRAANLPPGSGIQGGTAPMPPGESQSGQDGKSVPTSDPRAEVRTERKRPIGGPFSST